jgi:predicted O-methyltransferase YrrM
MNYSVIALLNERLTSEMSVFEYGSGYSTLYFASRVRTVASVEHSEEWRDSLLGELPDNATVMFRERDSDGAYCRAIHDGSDPYDVVVVDGRDRVNSLKQSIDRLSPGGVVLLDDSNRPAYSAAHDHARAAGFRALHFQGLKPRGKIMDESTLFYRDGNCFGI